MTDADQAVTLTDASEDGRAAELALAKIAEAKIMLASSPAARITLIVAEVVLTITGVWLRSHVQPGWPVVSTMCGLLAALGLAMPTLARRAARAEPKWVKAARVHQRSLAAWVPAATLEITDRCLDGLPRRRDGYLYVSRCTHPEPGHFEVCHGAGVFPVTGRCWSSWASTWPPARRGWSPPCSAMRAGM